MDDEDDENTFDELAATLAWLWPEVWPKLQVKHVPNEMGRCDACHSHALGTPVWPCRLRDLADEAERITVARSRASSPRR
jgi:hypothetical protein